MPAAALTPFARLPAYARYALVAALIAFLGLLAATITLCSIAFAQERERAEVIDSDGGVRARSVRREWRARRERERRRERRPDAGSAEQRDAAMERDASLNPLDAGVPIDAGPLVCEGSSVPAPVSPPPSEPELPAPGALPATDGVPSYALVLSLALLAVAGALVWSRSRRRRPHDVPKPIESAPARAPEPMEPLTLVRADTASSTHLVAVESRKGPVRSRCEDRSAAFVVRGVAGIVVGDGMGGHPDGEAAAEIAVESARRILVRELERQDRILSLAVVARAAIGAAAEAIRRAAPAFGYGSDEAALATTLLVLLADREAYVAAYLGDGGIVVVRADGSVDPLMDPQNGDTPNIVEGSLGPSGIDGRPEVRRAPRRPGDVALIGTDGVFARMPATFAPRMRELVVRRADAEVAIREALDALEALRDEHGQVADDNVTLGVLWTRG